MLNRIFPFLLLAVCLSCQDEDEWEPSANSDGRAVFTYTVSGEGLPTRFSGGQFEVNDRVGIYMFAHQANGAAPLSAATAKNVPYEVGAAGALQSVSGGIHYPSDGSSVNFVSYYPYAPTLTDGKIPVDVRTLVAYPLENMGLMYYNGVGTEQTEANGVANFNYKSQLSKLTVNVTPESGYAVDLSASPTLTIKGMPLTAKFNLSTGAMEEFGATTSTLTLKLNTAKSTSAKACWEALLIPHTSAQAAAGGRIFTFSFGGNQRTFNMKDKDNLEFKPGKEYTFDFELTDGITLSEPSNCYMVVPGQPVKFPVSRAYSSGNMLHIGDEYTGEFTATVVWADALVIDGAPSVKGAGNAATVTVKTKSGVSGNAVVAVKAGTNIVWSWHIWVTTYNPNVAGATFTNTYNTNNNGKNFVFMDRNLGATKAGRGKGLGTGLFYQWGRKDPFPGTLAPGVDQAGGGKFTTTNVQVSVITAIRTPGVFYTGGQNWLNLNVPSLWGHNAVKTIYDPCPSGWRVPIKSGADSTSPWVGFASDVYGSPVNQKPTAWDNGYGWGTNAQYPASGLRYHSNGVLWEDYVMVWSASSASDTNSWGFCCYNGSVFHHYSLNNGVGASVRCVQE
jgi:hypothetical protein